MKQKSIVSMLVFSFSIITVLLAFHFKEQQAQTAYAAAGPSCRFGVASVDDIHVPWVSTLNAGWFLK